MYEAELEGVPADLDQVVEEGAESGQRVGRREEGHVAELDEHLQIVVEGSVILQNVNFGAKFLLQNIRIS